MKSLQIVFFGASHNVFPIIETLNINFRLVKVITTESDEESSIIPYCGSKGIEVEAVHSKEELKNKVFTVKADLGVVADFGLIIPKEVLHHFRHGILNIHPSLLPKYRGPTPVQTALLNGDETTGVTIIRLDEQMDHGPILTQKEYGISPDDTAQSMYEILFRNGANIITEVIEQYIKRELKPEAQDDSKATYTKILSRQDGFVENYENLQRKIRAYFPWPGVWTKTYINKTEKRIIKFLPFNRVIVEGKNEMSYKDFINGYPDADPKLLNFLNENV